MNAAIQPPEILRALRPSREAKSGGSALWLLAMRQRSVWMRAAKVGLPIGCLQAVIDQGDVWLSHQATVGTLAKTIISPLVTLSVALIAAAGTWVEKQRTLPPPSVAGAMSVLSCEQLPSMN